MEYLNKIAKWFDGKKTIIGLIGMNIMQMNLNIFANMNTDLHTMLLWAFGALAAGGLTHKAIKKK